MLNAIFTTATAVIVSTSAQPQAATPSPVRTLVHQRADMSTRPTETKPGTAERMPVATVAQADPGEIALRVAEPVQDRAVREEWYVDQGQRAVHNVSQPTLTPFLPPAGKANGTAIIVAPGGGFMSLSMDNEGYRVARWLAEQGVTAFVLKYRLVQTPATTQGLKGFAVKVFTSGPQALVDVLAKGRPVAVADASQAMRLVRSRAGEWKIDPARVGFIGFSAGAITALAMAVQSDDAVRPNFVASIYGPMGRPSEPLPASLPPLWTALSGDDPLFGKSDMGLVATWQEKKAPLELHFYEKGGHGWGFTGAQGTTAADWPGEFRSWLRMRGLLSPR